jgi:hypothetical protein
MHIAAIQTRYKGYLFRSRLEARWAVFFDQCDVRYLYEDQGFSLPSGPYLPDFYLPQISAFVEIKASHMLPVDHFEFGQSRYPIRDDFPLELKLIHNLSQILKLAPEHAVVVYGDPFAALYRYRDAEPSGGAVCVSKHGLQASSGVICSFKNLEAAYTAREARFEHGATPQ